MEQEIQQIGNETPNFEVNIEPDQLKEDYKTLNDISYKLKDILDNYGKKCIVECFIRHFSQNKFQLGQVNEMNLQNQTRVISENDDSLFFYLNSTNRAFRNKRLPNNKKCVNFNNPVDINSMLYVQSTKLIHLSDNEKQLREIILDENRTILEEDKAFDILSSLDITLLVHMTNNMGLRLPLTKPEEKALMGLKEVRNNLTHKKESISITELKHMAELMSHALYIFDSQAWQFSKYHNEISLCFEVHNIKKMKAVLRAELLERIPDRNIISRKFKQTIDEPDYQGLSVDAFCDSIVEKCNINSHSSMKFFVCGNTFSGRTAALFDIFRHWVQPGSKMNESFEIVLPMFSRNENMEIERDFRKSLGSFLKMWAPNFSAIYSFDEFFGLLLKECEDVLVIADTSQRNREKILLDWEGKSVETALDIDKYDDNTLRFHLANLTEKEIENELVKSGANSWYDHFCDKSLLGNPAYLNLFQYAYEHSTDRTNINFAVLEVIAREAHRNASKEDIEKIEKLCFEHIYRDEDLYTVSELESFCGFYFSFVNDAKMCLNSMCIEEYLASCYAAKNMQVAGWIWLKKPNPFKRVMKSVLKIWKDSNKLEENLKHFSNFLSALTGLYVPENQRRERQNKNMRNITWDTRSDIWSLEDEGYVPSVMEVRFNQWKFLSHVLEATSREESIIECMRSVLIRCSSWVFSLKPCSLKENEQFNYLEHILRKIQLSTDSSLEFVKIQGEYSSYSSLPFIVKAIASMGGTTPPKCKSQIKLYFNRKFPGFKDDVKGSLCTFYRELSDYPIPLTVLQGPLVTGNAFSFAKTPCFNSLTRLTVHIFDYINMLKMLSVSLDNLSVLEIALDFTKSDEPMSKVVQRKIREGKMTQMTLPGSCRTKVAVRFTGDFKVLQLLSLIPKIHFLKLHGVYNSTYEDMGGLFGDHFQLNVDCLLVKFSKCYYGEQKNEGLPWMFRVPLLLAKTVPNVSRLLISQIPSRHFTAVIPRGHVSFVAYFVHQVLHKLPNLLRIIFKDSEISIKEASHLLSIMETREAQRRDGVWCCGKDLPVTHIKQQGCVKHCADMLSDLSKTVVNYIDERLNREETLQIHASQTETHHMELIITEAKHSTADDEMKEAIAKSTSSSVRSKLYDEAYYRNMLGFINQVQRSQLGRFCYQEYEDSHVIHCTEEGESFIHKPRRLQVLKNINKDIRINMDVPEFCDETYVTNTGSSSTTNPCLASSIIPVFAVAQYLNITTGNLTAKKILSFAALLYDTKEYLIRGKDKRVAPFSVTLNISDREELSREVFVKNIKEQCALMGHRLSGHTRDDDDHEFHYLSLMHILYTRNRETWYIKKAHNGDIHSSFKELCHKNKPLD